MADNLTGKAKLSVLPGKMSPSDTSRHEKAKSTDKSAAGTQKMTDPYKVRVDPSTKVGLFKLLDILPKDVYYSYGYKKGKGPKFPSLVATVKEIYPNMDEKHFVGVFSKASQYGKSLFDKKFYRPDVPYGGCKWILIKSDPNLTPVHVPTEQMDAFGRNASNFWPYETPDCGVPSDSGYYQIKSKSWHKDICLIKDRLHKRSVKEVKSLNTSDTPSDTPDAKRSRIGATPAKIQGTKNDGKQEVGILSKRLFKTTPCSGFSGEYLSLNIREAENKAEVQRGFGHICGEAIRNHGTAVSNCEPWEYHYPVIGVIRDMVKTKDNTDLYTVRDDGSGQLAIHAVGCENEFLDELGISSVCNKCRERRKDLIRRCRVAVTIRDNPLNTDTRNDFLLRSPSLASKKMEADRTLRRRLRARLRAKSFGRNGVALNNEFAAQLFDTTTEELSAQYFAKGKVGKDDVRRYLFQECLENARRAALSGIRSVRYSPILIRLCLTINKRFGRRWDEWARIFHLPRKATLDKYKSLDAGRTDGIMLTTLKAECETFRRQQKKRGNSQPDTIWFAMGVLSFDSAKCSDKVAFNFHTHELIGFAHDAFDYDVIDEEWKEEAKKSMADVDKQSIEDKLPPPAEHFLVFYFTTWAAGNEVEKLQFPVARYGLKSITSGSLAKKIQKIIVTLSFFGFVVNAVVSDGASENRSCFHLLATLTAADVLSLSRDQKAALPVDKKIAFPHPTRKDVVIFIWSDMPHWVKKFVNALERSDLKESKTDLQFRGKPLTLMMLYDIWKESGGCDDSSLSTNKFTEEHFNKNSYNRMRVYLSTQVCSSSMCRLIDEFASEPSWKRELYAPLRTIIQNVDRLIDIFNGTQQSRSGEEKGAGNITSPTHVLLSELLGILGLFAEWQREAGCNSSHFIPSTLYEDLIWMVFGLVGVAQKCLKEDRSRVLVQRRGNTDVLEHCFAHIRQYALSQDFSVKEGRRCLSDGAAQRVYASLFSSKGNNRDSLTPEELDWADANEPLVKAKR